MAAGAHLWAKPSRDPWREATTQLTEDMEWIPASMETVPGLVARHGGRYVYRTTDADPVEMPSGTPATFAVCIEWSSADAANAFYADPDYQPHKQRRLDGSATSWYNAPAFTE